MILLLDTSTPVCRIELVDGDARYSDEWQSDRQLAKGLLGYIQETLAKHHTNFKSLQGIGAYKGPGSFTGLRIGLTVANTLAESLEIPIIGASGESWKYDALERLASGHNDRIVMPDYGAEANITKPRK